MNSIIKNILITIINLIIIFNSNLISQTQQDLRINEVLIINNNGIINEKGQKTPWIEIFNTSYTKINIGGIYITDDPKKLNKCLIPKSSYTYIPPRSHMILWADGYKTQGSLHTSFKLDTSSSFLALVESNGKNIIDSITLPKPKPDTSYARKYDGANLWEYKADVTPGSPNQINQNNISAAELFVKYDKTGVGLTIIAMSVVFTALLLLYLSFKNIAKLFSLDLKKAKLIKKGKLKEADAIKSDTTGEVAAAIAMSLYLYLEQLHDEENTIITIKRISKTYSPWSSKIYGLRQFNKKQW